MNERLKQAQEFVDEITWLAFKCVIGVWFVFKAIH